MLEGRLFKQCRFTFGQRKKDYHLLSSNVERRPPSHSSSGMWKQWGKLNSQQLTLFHVCEPEMVISKANAASHTLAAGTLTDCSETQISVSWWQFYRHSNIKKGQMAEEMGPEPLKNLPTIFFSIFGSSVSAGWPDKAAKAHRAISTLSLDASNLAYLSRYSKLIYEHSKLYTAHLCRLLVQCVHRTVQWASHHFQPMTKSSHSASWLHTEHSHSWYRYLVAAQRTSLSRLSIDHHLWALQFPLLLSCESFQATPKNLLFCSPDKSPPPSHELAADWNGYEIFKALK